MADHLLQKHDISPAILRRAPKMNISQPRMVTVPNNPSMNPLGLINSPQGNLEHSVNNGLIRSTQNGNLIGNLVDIQKSSQMSTSLVIKDSLNITPKRPRKESLFYINIDFIEIRTKFLTQIRRISPFTPLKKLRLEEFETSEAVTVKVEGSV